jgi:hypothetical protein
MISGVTWTLVSVVVSTLGSLLVTPILVRTLGARNYGHVRLRPQHQRRAGRCSTLDLCGRRRSSSRRILPMADRRSRSGTTLRRFFWCIAAGGTLLASSDLCS